jgi:phage terminase large subunit
MSKPCRTYYLVKKSRKRFIVNQGGARSGKSYSILQLLIEFCHLNRDAGQVISIIRKTAPSLKATIYRDFITILEDENWYDFRNHNKTEKTYNLFGNLVEFVSVDKPQKVRGRKRDIAYLNEANELTGEDFLQINLRTRLKVIIDYNPSFLELEWLDNVIARPECSFYISTYKDNLYLPIDQVKEIEALEHTNPDLWKIYGLGQRTIIEGLIFPKWEAYKSEKTPEGEVIYGLDFGYTDPMVLTKIYINKTEIVIKEEFYERSVITKDLIEFMEEKHINKQPRVNKDCPIYCDGAEPDRIKELVKAGFNAFKADKSKGSVKAGIDYMLGLNLKIDWRSLNVIRDFKNYQRQKKVDGTIIDEPAHAFSHAPDACRYALYTHYCKNRGPLKTIQPKNPHHQNVYDHQETAQSATYGF